KLSWRRQAMGPANHLFQRTGAVGYGWRSSQSQAVSSGRNLHRHQYRCADRSTLRELMAYHEEKRAVATLVLRLDPLADQYGSMDIDGDGRIHRFLQTRVDPAFSGAVTKLMFTGVQILEPRVFDYLESDRILRKFSTTKDTYPRMLLGQERLFGFRFDGF